VKIGSLDTGIALLTVKNKEKKEGKIYSPSSKFSKRAKSITLLSRKSHYLRELCL